MWMSPDGPVFKSYTENATRLPAGNDVALSMPAHEYAKRCRSRSVPLHSATLVTVRAKQLHPSA